MSSSLPERPRLEQYRRQAKDLAAAARSGESAALALLREHHPAAIGKAKLRLSDAQHALARSLGFSSWPKLRAAVVGAENEAFLEAVRSERAEEVRSRLRDRPQLAKVADGSGITGLHLAAETGNLEIARLLIEAGADIRRTYGSSTHTALSWAVTVGSFDFAEEMIRQGDEPDLFCAAGLGHLDWVRRFWVNDKLIDRPSRTGCSRFGPNGERLPCPPESREDLIGDALYMAARHGRLEVVEWLLQKGGDPNYRGFLGGTALHWAEFSGNAAVAEAIRRAGGSDDLRDDQFEAIPRAFGILTPTAWGITRLLAHRLEREPELANVRGGRWAPLEAAAIFDQPLTAYLLVRAGADREAINAEGKRASDIAREKGHDKVVRVLEEF